MNLGALRDRELRAQVCAAAEAVQAETTTFRQRGTLECAIPDDPRTQQGREGDVVDVVRQVIGKVGGHSCVFGIAAVDVPPGV